MRQKGPVIATLRAPRFSRISVFATLVLIDMTLVFIAVYPPMRLPQTIIAGLAFVVSMVATCRVLRAAYLVTDTELRLRGLFFTQTIPKEEIVGFLSASGIQRRDHWGSVQIVSSYLFRHDRVFGRTERARVLDTLRSWLHDKPPSSP